VYTDLLREVDFADSHGLSFVSIPERHFALFGGAFPNSALLCAAIAARTKRIQIRSGSFIAPLHDICRAVEDWSMVDNLCEGRLAISIGSGWNVNDFAFFPQRFVNRGEYTMQFVTEFRRIWKGREIKRHNGAGQEVTLRLYPSPCQAELPLWCTSSGNQQTFIEAGRLGMNLLTHLENQDRATLSKKIQAYREARAVAGHEPHSGIVTLMLHACVVSTPRAVASVEHDLRDYLSAAVTLERMSVEQGGMMSGRKNVAGAVLRERAIVNPVIDEAVRKYTENGLIACVDECVRRIHSLSDVGVDEIACLTDFVSDPGLRLASLNSLAQISEILSSKSREQYQRKSIAAFCGANQQHEGLR
jgi:natural product biosynthesis luciferase-like monooxygenase protein